MMTPVTTTPVTMTTTIRLALAALALPFLVSLPPAVAKSDRVASYSFDRVWPAAVRFLRVDEGATILEKDAETGYVIFELRRGDKTYRGALELVKVKDHAERDSVRLVVRIDDRPLWEEEGLLRRLLEKLREELGQPRDPPRQPDPEPKPEPEDEEAAGA